MGFNEPELFESDEALIDYQLGRALPGIDFDALKAKGTIEVSQAPVILHRDLKFATPSGRIEIASARAAARRVPARRTTNGRRAPGPRHAASALARPRPG